MGFIYGAWSRNILYNDFSIQRRKTIQQTQIQPDNHTDNYALHNFLFLRQSTIRQRCQIKSQHQVNQKQSSKSTEDEKRRKNHQCPLRYKQLLFKSFIHIESIIDQ